MSKLVEEQDAESAINLINFAYFKKVIIHTTVTSRTCHTLCWSSGCCQAQEEASGGGRGREGGTREEETCEGGQASAAQEEAGRRGL